MDSYQLRGGAKMIYSSISSGGVLRASVFDLAARADVSPRQARRIVKRLEHSGLLSVQRMPGMANSYSAKVAL